MPSSSTSQSLNALPPGAVLHDYIIESELGSGGFSMVYLARHRLNTDWLFAIKEYLPRDLAVRDNDGASVHPVNTEAEDAFEDGRRRFRDEAEQLRRFRNERHVVSCLNYFEANGTAYLVMDYDDGLPLSEFLRQREEAGQPFTEADLRAVVEPLLEGLEVVHRTGVLHRDIKPGNVFVRRPDDIAGRPAQPVLIDFGAAKQNYLEQHSRSRAPYTPGYAAYEQISSEGDIGPWTDIYAIGALMWRMVAGGCPDDPRLLITDEAGRERTWSPTPRAAEKRAYALHRGRPDPTVPAAELGAGRFSKHLLESIDKCLALYPEDRVQDCGVLRALLDASETSGYNTSYERYNHRDEAAHDPKDGQGYRDPVGPDSESRETGQSETSSFGFGLIPAAAVASGVLLMAIVFVDMGAFEDSFQVDLEVEGPISESSLSLAVVPDDGVANGTLELGDFELSSGAYSDLWAVQAESGQVLTADLSSAGFDAFLMLMSPTDVELVAEDDDSGDGTNARITFDVADSGEHLLVASSYEAGETGDYELRVDVSSAVPATFTRGSHEEDVLRIQGTPTGIDFSASGYELWSYGPSTVQISISSRRVMEWNNFQGNLRIRLEPGSNTTTSSTFTRGSHEDDVIRIQGTPSGIFVFAASGYELWSYGLSTVQISISSRRVTEWNNLEGNLRIR